MTQPPEAVARRKQILVVVLGASVTFLLFAAGISGFTHPRFTVWAACAAAIAFSIALVIELNLTFGYRLLLACILCVCLIYFGYKAQPGFSKLASSSGNSSVSVHAVGDNAPAVYGQGNTFNFGSGRPNQKQ